MLTAAFCFGLVLLAMVVIGFLFLDDQIFFAVIVILTSLGVLMARLVPLAKSILLRLVL